jgi:hypothetical protein
MKRAVQLPRTSAVHARRRMIEQLTDAVGDEWMEWYRMTPAERWRASGQLWDVYVAMGGSLDPEPDTQSPFNFLPS